jgi:hypothetical protein
LRFVLKELAHHAAGGTPLLNRIATQLSSLIWDFETTLSWIFIEIASINGRPGDLIKDDFYWKSGYGGHMLLIVPTMDLVLVHRVNTNKGDSVNGLELFTLLTMIIDARENATFSPLFLLLN